MIVITKKNALLLPLIIKKMTPTDIPKGFLPFLTECYSLVLTSLL